MNAKYRYINICFTICGILLLINLHSCSEILEFDSIENNKYAEKLKENGHNLFLPVDLRDFFSQKNGTLKYNTKSSFNNNLVMPPLDSILNWNGAVQQNYTNRIVFTQIPIIDSLYSNNFASITRYKEDIGNSKAPVRIFLIEYENCNTNYKERYFATMIPTSLQNRLRANYDFLNKPNFSGIIIYSDTTGKYITTDILENGLIKPGTILPTDSTDVLTDFRHNKTYLALYGRSYLMTKSEPENEDIAWTDELQGICIVAESDRNNNIIYPISLIYTANSDIQTEEYAQKSRVVEGGSIDDSDSTCKSIYHNLTVNGSGCYYPKTGYTQQYTSGTTVNLKAFPMSDSCIFFCWTEYEYIISNTPDITIVMDKSHTITSHYVSAHDNPECFNLAKIANDSVLLAQISLLRQKTLTNQIEYGFLSRSNGTSYNISGTKSSLNFKLEPGIIYSSHFHSHPSGTIFPSHADLLALYNMVINSSITNTDDFKYGTVTDDKILILSIKDVDKFEKYFDNITQDKSKLKRVFEKIYTESFSHFLSEISFENLLPIFTKLMNEMGLSVTMGSTFYNINNQKNINWQLLETLSLPDAATELMINKCI